MRGRDCAKLLSRPLLDLTSGRAPRAEVRSVEAEAALSPSFGSLIWLLEIEITRACIFVEYHEGTSAWHLMLGL
jgi:hypothetical protein